MPADNNENPKKGSMEQDPRKLLSNCDVIIEKSFLSIFKGCLLLINSNSTSVCETKFCGIIDQSLFYTSLYIIYKIMKI